MKPCPGCGYGEAQEAHECPYQSDVNNDSEFTCECCDECRRDCLEDI